MKQGGLRAICLLLASVVVAGFAFADDRTMNLESKVVQDFDKAEEQNWFVLGSKFASAGFPKINFIKTWPVSLYGTDPKERDNLQALGVAMLFDRKEYNWVDIVPGSKQSDSDGKSTYVTKEIGLTGRVQKMDVWVWGSGFRYYMEAYFRDYRGIVHKVDMGMIDHEGWKNIVVDIPKNIPQSKPTLPKHEGMKLVKFRIWTTPFEAVAVLSEDEDTSDPKATADKTKEQPISKAVFVYLDHIKILTDTYETMYDGDSLSNMENVKKNWSSGSGAGTGK